MAGAHGRGRALDIKALTLSQPYTSLDVSGEKWVENRTWPTRRRGYFAIQVEAGIRYLSACGMREKRLPTNALSR